MIHFSLPDWQKIRRIQIQAMPSFGKGMGKTDSAGDSLKQYNHKGENLAIYIKNFLKCSYPLNQLPFFSPSTIRMFNVALYIADKT